MYHHPPKPSDGPDPPSAAHRSSCARCTTVPVNAHASATPMMITQGTVALRSRAVRARTARNFGMSVGRTMRACKNCGNSRIMMFCATASAMMSNGTPTRRRACTPKCWSSGSGVCPCSGSALPAHQAHKAIGSHASAVQKTARRPTPSPPLRGMSPMLRCQRNGGSSRTREMSSRESAEAGELMGCAFSERCSVANVRCERTTSRTVSIEYRFPVALHAHYGNTALARLVERLGERAQLELPVVGDLALGVVVVQQQREPRAGAANRVAQHREVAVRIAEREDRPAADVEADVLRLHVAVVEAVELPELHQHRPAVLDLEAELGAGADHLFARDAVG